MSEEPKKLLAARTESRFGFLFAPEHGPWLNLVEDFFTKMARPDLGHIGVASKAEPKQGLWHTWTASTVCPSFTPDPRGSRCRGG